VRTSQIARTDGREGYDLSPDRSDKLKSHCNNSEINKFKDLNTRVSFFGRGDSSRTINEIRNAVVVLTKYDLESWTAFLYDHFARNRIGSKR
jgi:hypothetical protein